MLKPRIGKLRVKEGDIVHSYIGGEMVQQKITKETVDRIEYVLSIRNHYEQKRQNGKIYLDGNLNNGAIKISEEKNNQVNFGIGSLGKKGGVNKNNIEILSGIFYEKMNSNPTSSELDKLVNLKKKINSCFSTNTRIYNEFLDKKDDIVVEYLLKFGNKFNEEQLKDLL